MAKESTVALLRNGFPHQISPPNSSCPLKTERIALSGTFTGGTTASTTKPSDTITVPTLVTHLTRRLTQAGASDVFAIPGRINLTLLRHLFAEPGLNLIRCCNELNAGYAADGYARAKGVGACIVNFHVGSLSIINAIAGAYSENVPVICIVGGANADDFVTNPIPHQYNTVERPADTTGELRCFRTVTCYQAIINNLDNARELIDTAFDTCLKERKPVYISVNCSLSAIPHPSFADDRSPGPIAYRLSNKFEFEAAVEATAHFLNNAAKPVLVAGPKIRLAESGKEFVELADACGYPIAVMPAAKGLVPENHPHFLGTYWGAVSTAFCAEIVESADAYLFAGPSFDDSSTVGYSLLLRKEKSVVVEPESVVVRNGTRFGGIPMKDFLSALSKRLKHNPTAYENYERIFVPDGSPPKSDLKGPLRVNVLFKHIQEMLSSDSTVIAETGDSWFNCQKLKLPPECGYESQMLYGSIGWSVGATLGYAQAAKDKRVLSCIGDGSFQVTAQDVSTMLRCKQRNIIFLINNGSYTIEVQIHDGPYNIIKNWNYTAFVDAIHNGEGKCWTMKVKTEEELKEAIESAKGPKKDCLCFIEVIVHRDDTSKELLGFGRRMAEFGGRLPIPAPCK